MTKSKKRSRKGEKHAVPQPTPPDQIPRIELVRDRDYQAANAHLFPSFESLRWFIRQRRARLIAAGALEYHLDRCFIVAPQFEREFRTIGVEATRERFKERVAA